MQPLIRVVDWSDDARDELLPKARGRSLVIDYFSARCCGSNVSIGDLSVRWQRADDTLTDEFTPVDGPDGIDMFMARDLVGVLALTHARLVMRGVGWLRHPAIELEDGSIWLDFLASCRRRSALRH